MNIRLRFLIVLLAQAIAWPAFGQTSAITPGPTSYCEASPTTVCRCDAGATVDTNGVCDTSAQCGGGNCVLARIYSSSTRDQFTTAKSEIQGLMDRDPDAPTLGQIAIYEGAGGDKLAASACTITSSGAGELQCTAGARVDRNSASAALTVDQDGAGYALNVAGTGGSRFLGGASAGAKLMLGEGVSNGSNEVTIAAPANLTASNTIEFTANGRIDYDDLEAGIVLGAASVNDNTFARYDGTTGELLQWSATAEDDFGSVTMATDPGTSGPVLSLTNQAATNILEWYGEDTLSLGYVGPDAEVSLFSDTTSANGALFVQQANASTGVIAKLVNASNEGMVIGANGATTLTNDSGVSLTITQQSTGNILSALDSSSEGIIVETDGNLVVAGDDATEYALQVTAQANGGGALIVNGGTGRGLRVEQNGTGDIFSFVKGVVGLWQNNDGGVMLEASDDSTPALSITNGGTGGMITASGDLSSFTLESTGALSHIANSSAGTAYDLTQGSTTSPVRCDKTNTTGDDPQRCFRQFRVATSDNTATVIGSISVASGKMASLRASINARVTAHGSDAGKGVHYLLGCSAFNISGTMSSVSTTTLVSNEGTLTSFNASCVQDDTSDEIDIRITGDTGYTVTWQAHVEYENGLGS